MRSELLTSFLRPSEHVAELRQTCASRRLPSLLEQGWAKLLPIDADIFALDLLLAECGGSAGALYRFLDGNGWRSELAQTPGIEHLAPAASLILSLAQIGRQTSDGQPIDRRLIHQTLLPLASLFGNPFLARLETPGRRRHLNTACAVVKAVVALDSSTRTPELEIASGLIDSLLDGLVAAGERSSTSQAAYVLLDDLVRAALALLNVTTSRPSIVSPSTEQPSADGFVRWTAAASSAFDEPSRRSVSNSECAARLASTLRRFPSLPLLASRRHLTSVASPFIFQCAGMLLRIQVRVTLLFGPVGSRH